MLIFNELRARAKQIVAPVIGVAAVIYFGHHTLQGEHGVLTLLHLSSQVEQANATLHTLETKRSQLANRVRLLHPDHLDLDMLDEQARRLLNLGRVDEVLILMPPTNADVKMQSGGLADNN